MHYPTILTSYEQAEYAAHQLLSVPSPASPYSQVSLTSEYSTTSSRDASCEPFSSSEDGNHVGANNSSLHRSTTITSTTAPLPKSELTIELNLRFLELYEKNPRAWLKREYDMLRRDRRAARRASNRFKNPTKYDGTQMADYRTVLHPSNGISPRFAQRNREDKNFEDLPDYCPPIDSLDHRSNSFNVYWKGPAFDLSNDPYKPLLHQNEVMLAASLRLDCATYLASKRRIFESRLRSLLENTPFLKTHAQQACRIDVNKASQLWLAFYQVGWFDESWMKEHVRGRRIVSEDT